MVRDTILHALADPTRRGLFERLLQAPASVGELVEEVPVSQPAVSQHLKVLREAGLVEVERSGRRRIYGPRAAGLAELRRWVETLWDDALGSFEEYSRRGGEGR